MSGDRMRASRFVDLFLPVMREWDQRLRQANEVDFEDMINRAADLIEAKAWTSPYELVMVDEMQDSSHARSRLVRALLAEPGRYLFAVGDDWQSINRFAGSDLSVMTRFTEWFGTRRDPQTGKNIPFPAVYLRHLQPVRDQEPRPTTKGGPIRTT